MKLTYIFHSGFLAETAKCYYLFDYCKGELPKLDAAKPILVFVSHSHADHYNPAVFDMLSDMGMQKVGAILPNDIKKTKYPQGMSLLENDGFSAADGCADRNLLNRRILRVHHSRSYDFPMNTRIRTLLSTDSGVAFLLTCPEGTLFHAGDLNDWITEDMSEAERRQMTGSYRAALRGLEGIEIDAACLPLDPHLGAHYADGFLYFLKKINSKKVWPMHFGDRPEIVDRFLREHPEYADIVRKP